MKNNFDLIKPGAIVEGLSLPEPVRITSCQPMGDSIKIEGEGLQSKKYHQIIMDSNQLEQLTISPIAELFDGDPVKFRLGVEAQRLALAYEYDPYFSLSI